MNNYKLKCAFLLCVSTSMICIGCLSLVEKAGQVLDGSAFAEKKIAVYKAEKKNGASMDIEVCEVQNKAGERSLVIILGQFPGIKIRGTTPDNEGNFSLTTLDYLGGNSYGWNEYCLDLSGQAYIRFGETSAVFAIPHNIETVQISWGRIRRYDTRITGNEALINLQNRRERILALCEWMNSRHDSPNGLNRKEFENYWKPLLFPETIPKKKRPRLQGGGGWEKEGDQWIKSEDINWNTGYTERTFPELLRPIRDSGTMLRDWEEAFDWIMLEYEWERIMAQLSHETILQRVRSSR